MMVAVPGKSPSSTVALLLRSLALFGFLLIIWPDPPPQTAEPLPPSALRPLQPASIP
jgi:hypothetical protein